MGAAPDAHQLGHLAYARQAGTSDLLLSAPGDPPGHDRAQAQAVGQR